MVSTKLVALSVCVVVAVCLFENSAAQGANVDANGGGGDSPHTHHHRIKGSTHHHSHKGPSHTHHFREGGSGSGGGSGDGDDGGSPNVHHHRTEGSVHTHHSSNKGSGSPSGGLGGDISGNLNLGGSGGLGLNGDVNLGGGSGGLDLGGLGGDLNLGGSGGLGLGGDGGSGSGLNLDGGSGGPGLGATDVSEFLDRPVPDGNDPKDSLNKIDLGTPRHTHVPEIFKNLPPQLIEELKTVTYGHFGIDSEKPKQCLDRVGFEDGVWKHFWRGSRDALVALVDGVLGLAGFDQSQASSDNLIGKIQKAAVDLLCGAEDAFSDFGDDFDSATHFAKHGLINAFTGQGDGLAGLVAGTLGVGKEALDAVVSVAEDAFTGTGAGLRDLFKQDSKKN